MDETSLGALVRQEKLLIGDGHRAKLAELGGTGPWFLRAGALSDRGFDFSNLDAFESPVGLEKKLGQAGDVVITTKGNSIGRVGWVPDDAPQFVYSPHLSFWRSLDRSSVLPRFLYYWARSDAFYGQVRALGFGTDMAPYLSLRDQETMRIALPKLIVQVAIADVLGALDDKIAANDQLREITDRLLQAELDKLSIGHGEAELSAIADVNARMTKPRSGGMLRYVDISSVSQGSYTFPVRTAWDEAPGRARRTLRHGDTIWSTVRPNRRSHALVLDSDPSLVASTGLAVLSPRPGRVAGLYEATRRDRFVAYLESVAEGSAYPAVRAERFATAPVPDLGQSEWDRFEAFALPLRQRAHAAVVENRALAAARDELLPLLMSGRLRVKDAEHIVEAAL